LDTRFNFHNILVIDFGQLGDVVLSLSALAAIRKRFPNARISALTGKVPGEVIKLSDAVDEAITVDRVELRDGPRISSIRKVFALAVDMRKRRFDLVIDLHSLSETNILAFLTTAKHRLLANRESRSLDVLSNFRPRPPKEDKAKHLTDRYFDVLRPLGINGGERAVTLTPRESDLAFVDEKFYSHLARPAIGLFPGAGHPSRCWPLEKFVALAGLIANNDNSPVVFLGPEEQGMREQVAALFPAGTTIIDGLNIPQFIAAASRLDAFVTNDTGPMHLAACSGTPILLLLGGKAPDTSLPLPKDLIVIRGENIRNITVDEAEQSLARLLSATDV
jgi:ADP-heptose:LPS heptosyltransferase